MPQPVIRKRTLDCLPQQVFPHQSLEKCTVPSLPGKHQGSVNTKQPWPSQSCCSTPPPTPLHPNWEAAPFPGHMHVISTPRSTGDPYSQSGSKQPSISDENASSAWQSSTSGEEAAVSPSSMAYARSPVFVSMCRDVVAVSESCLRTSGCHSGSAKEGLQRWLSG